jgi:hypothetical protein
MTTQTLSAAQLQRGPAVSFVLPPGTKEGPGRWYVLHLHAAVVIDRSSPGTGYLSAASSGFGSAQIVFKVVKDKPVFWQTVSLLGGTQSHTTGQARIELRFDNFLPYGGVHPGRNTLHISVEQFGGSPIRTVTLYDDSALIYTPRGPGKLVVQLRRNEAVGHTGKRLVATLRVRNVGQRPVSKIRISAVLGAPDLRLVGQTTRSRGALQPGKSLYESFALVPQSANNFRVFFVVSSTANRPGAELNFSAVGAPLRSPTKDSTSPGRADSSNNWWIEIAAVAGVLALLVSVAGYRMRR